MGNNLDCSNKKSQAQVYTLEPALGNSPPLLLLLPQKQILTSLSGFTLMPFWFSLPIHALKDLKPLCKLTLAPLSQDFAKFMVCRSSKLNPAQTNQSRWSCPTRASAVLCLKPFPSLGKHGKRRERWGSRGKGRAAPPGPAPAGEAEWSWQSG